MVVNLFVLDEFAVLDESVEFVVVVFVVRYDDWDWRSDCVGLLDCVGD